MKFKIITVLVITLLVMAILKTSKVVAPVPVTVWGYVYMPDGTKASGATVTVKGGGDTKSTSTNSEGKYSVTLNAANTPITVTVKAKKGEYSGSASKSNVEGVVRIDVRLKKTGGGGGGGGAPTPKKKKVILELHAPKEVAVNSTVTIVGYTSPARVNATVKIIVEGPGAIAFEENLKTNSQGQFHYSFSPWTIGLWKIHATCKGNEEYYDASSHLEIIVKKLSLLTLNVEPSIAPVGSPIKLYGCLDPRIDTIIKLYFSFDNSTWFSIMDINATNGCYEVEWLPNFYGVVYLKAFWNGTQEYFKSEAYTYLSLRITYRRTATLTIYTNSSTVLVNKPLYFSIKIEPALKNAVIKLEYSKNGSYWEDIGEVITDSEGLGSIVWRFTSSGAYIIRAYLKKPEDYDKVCNYTIVNVIEPTTLLILDTFGKPLLGAKIIIKNVGEYTLSPNGTVVLALKPGNYEIEVLAGERLLGSFRAEIGKEHVIVKSLGETLQSLPSYQMGIQVILYDLHVLVFDDDGKPISGQKVELFSSNIKTETTTNDEGVAMFKDLPKGNYTVKVDSIEKNVSIPEAKVVYIRVERMNLFGDRLKEIMLCIIIALVIALAVLITRKL